MTGPNRQASKRTRNLRLPRFSVRQIEATSMPWVRCEASETAFSCPMPFVNTTPDEFVCKSCPERRQIPTRNAIATNDALNKFIRVFSFTRCWVWQASSKLPPSNSAILKRCVLAEGGAVKAERSRARGRLASHLRTVSQNRPSDNARRL